MWINNKIKNKLMMNMQLKRKKKLSLNMILWLNKERRKKKRNKKEQLSQLTMMNQMKWDLIRMLVGEYTVGFLLKLVKEMSRNIYLQSHQQEEFIN